MSYEDIIHMERPKSLKHRPMPMEERAAQFSPFAALTGYDEAIEETSRITDKKPEISDEKKDEINSILSFAIKNPDLNLEIIHFIPDEKKEGGRISKIRTRIKKLDEASKEVILENRSSIPFSDILDLKMDESPEL